MRRLCDSEKLSSFVESAVLLVKMVGCLQAAHNACL